MTKQVDEEEEEEAERRTAEPAKAANPLAAAMGLAINATIDDEADSKTLPAIPLPARCASGPPLLVSLSTREADRDAELEVKLRLASARRPL
eukprot:CAMPEP_0171129594 /NCGR_PEP_ID=MMETSP0766_2-20121228/119266_1 /TAXON_ID=439317 /ORGANISM="Gambierdiscus australes, Strain CAWD 149" /LENGTH=91 /DNA_ID=CAMNT_0011592801 /DNA_START=15 /DNA_END=288 /DNA_ORIENTATION=+